MSIDWNWGIFLQEAPSAIPPISAGYGVVFRSPSPFRLPPGLSLSGRIYFRHFTYRSQPFPLGLGTLYVELFRNVPLIVQFFTRTRGA